MLKRVKPVWSILKGMSRRIGSANVSLVAAGTAFFTMLSLFPAIAAIIALLGFVADPSVVDQQLELIARFIPISAYTILETQTQRLVAANSSALGWATLISTGAALWSARLGTDALIKALNAVYDAPMRGGIRAAATALALTLALIFVVLLALMTLVVLPLILSFFPLGMFAGIVLGLARWTTALVVVISGIWVLYRFAPNIRHSHIPWISPGSVLAIVVWALGSWGFSFYIANFASYNEVYGSIGAVIALLMFLYLSVFIVLLGATLNAELAAKAARESPDPDHIATALPVPIDIKEATDAPEAIEPVENLPNSTDSDAHRRNEPALS